MKRLRPAVFLDRDGVINEDRADHVKTWDEFKFIAGVFEPLASLARSYETIVVITNQSAIGRGLLSVKVFRDINARMRNEVTRCGGRIDAIYYCPHPPEVFCECRKPNPGLLFRAARDLQIDLTRSFFIGDAVSDVDAALSAGVRPIMVRTGRGASQAKFLTGSRYSRVPLLDDLAVAITLAVAQPQSAGLESSKKAKRESDDP